jgi:O-antigen ligase
MRQMRVYAAIIVVMLAVAGVIGEVRSGTVSRWLRKTEQVADDERTLSDALTSSRRLLVEECMRDFRKNPMWGMGFQVDAATAEKTKGRGLLVFSAAIEKGVLPVMILGETGIIGSGIFLVFLVTFFSVCVRRRYKATAALFCVFLASNMGEATFFSPSGVGGLLWVILVAGGFMIDMEACVRNAVDSFAFLPDLPRPEELWFDDCPPVLDPDVPLDAPYDGEVAIEPSRPMPVPQP